VVKIIRGAKDTPAAAEQLKSELALSDEQTDAILKMRLAQLTTLEGNKIDSEYEEKLRVIAEYEQILGSELLLDETIKKELREINDKYLSERRTLITDEDGNI